MSSALEFFLTGRRDVAPLEMVEISHSAFTETYWKVRNHRLNGGVSARLENGTMQWFDWYPLGITQLGDQADLDTGIRVDFGDLGEVLPRELDAVYAADAMAEKPKVVYRVYQSDDLETPVIGPIRLEANAFSFKADGASFEAAAPYVNQNRTGETYNLTRFPMLRSFLK